MTATGSLRRRLQTRFVSYSLVGISTYILDIALLFLLLNTTTLSQPIAIGTSFFVGVTSNFLLCYYWVYRGTQRDQLLGYAIFAGLATLGVILVTLTTEWFATTWGMNVYVARTVVATFVGLINFSINTFFNFRLY
jgi:putative flippase GtrA